MPVFNWSQTAATNSTADATINWAEGQAPSTVNDSARSMMAALAKYRDDISGSIVTSGSSTAYTVTSNSSFDTLAHLNGQLIAFTPHTTCGATVTLNVDSLGAKPLRSSPSVELATGTLIQGTPYVAVYNSSDGAFYIQSFFGANPYNVPLGAGMDYWGSSAPNSSFAFPTGQAISRTTYANLFSLISTTYGVGDGSTTFNLPDKTGRISAMKEASATRLTTAGFGGNSTNLGATGGLETHTNTLGELPGLTATQSGITITSNNVPTVGSSISNFAANISGGGGVQVPTPSSGTWSNQGPISINVSASVASTGGAGGGNASPHVNVQPTIICNYIIRVL